jgi:hypothetical protein
MHIHIAMQQDSPIEQTCSTLYALRNTSMLLRLLLNQIQHHYNLPSSAFGNLSERTLGDLRCLLVRARRAQRIWDSDIGVPRRVWKRTLEPGDHLDRAVPGTPCVLVRNPTARTLRCVNMESGEQSPTVKLDPLVQISCLEPVSSGDKIAYTTTQDSEGELIVRYGSASCMLSNF